VLKLYIMTLSVLEPYRRLGIGSKMLQWALDWIASEEGKKHDIKEVYLHVQTSNQEALAFYKKFGFEVTLEKKDYYRQLDPPHAYFLTKKV